MRSVLSCAIPAAIVAALTVTPAAAQGIGIGGRLSLARGDVATDTVAERFTGGHIRAPVSGRASIELALDLKNETNKALTERTRDYPVQASLLLYPVRSTIAPYVLGGVGWYSKRVEQLDGETILSSETERRVGTHAGFGAELRLGRHAALHGDYRYTFLRFKSDDEEEPDTGAAAALGGLTGSRFLPTYEGSMWTFGLTVYF